MFKRIGTVLLHCVSLLSLSPAAHAGVAQNFQIDVPFFERDPFVVLGIAPEPKITLLNRAQMARDKLLELYSTGEDYEEEEIRSSVQEAYRFIEEDWRSGSKFTDKYIRDGYSMEISDRELMIAKIIEKNPQLDINNIRALGKTSDEILRNYNAAATSRIDKVANKIIGAMRAKLGAEDPLYRNNKFDLAFKADRKFFGSFPFIARQVIAETNLSAGIPEISERELKVGIAMGLQNYIVKYAYGGAKPEVTHVLRLAEFVAEQQFPSANINETGLVHSAQKYLHQALTQVVNRTLSPTKIGKLLAADALVTGDVGFGNLNMELHRFGKGRNLLSLGVLMYPYAEYRIMSSYIEGLTTSLENPATQKLALDALSASLDYTRTMKSWEQKILINKINQSLNNAGPKLGLHALHERISVHVERVSGFGPPPLCVRGTAKGFHLLKSLGNLVKIF